jgi:hypothetical protein
MFGFRRRSKRVVGARSADADLSADPFQGVVLLDNTTIFGARHALEWDPVLPRQLPSGVDLRSLMDVLEAIVLFNDFAIDSSSREYYAWPALNEVSARSGSFFRDTDILGGLSDGVDWMLLAASAEKTTRLLDSGALVAQLGFLPSIREVEVLPPFYRDSEQFADLTLGIGERELDPNARVQHGAEMRSAVEHVRKLIARTRPLPDHVRSFAFFAYRGFYYQDLAHLISASYMPHSWRSGVIRSQLEKPVVHFSDLVQNQVAEVRRELARQINGEFGAATLSAEFPLIASYVISQSDTRGALLSTAAEVRRNAKAAAFRSWIYEIERKLRNQEDLYAVRQAQRELKAVVGELVRELGLTKKDKQEVKLKLGVPMASLETARSIPLSAPPWVRRVLRRRTHLVFLRELARESTRLAPFALAFQQLAP